MENNTNKPPVENKQENKKDSKIDKPKNKKLLSIILILFILLFLLVSYATFYFYNYNQSINQKIVNLTDNINKLQIEQTQSLQNNNQAINTLVKEQQNIQKELNDLHKRFENAKAQQANQSDEWILSKAHYYIELAKINAYWGEDYQSVIVLLQQSDNLLTQINEPNIFELRKALAEKIAQIKDIPEIDKVGLLTKLNAAINQIDNLPLQKSTTAITQSYSEKLRGEDVEENETWQERLKQNLLPLKKLVVIKKLDNSDAIILPNQEMLLRSKLKLTLKQTELAILQNNQEIFEHSLNDAINQIKNVFDENNQTTNTLLKQLTDLKEIKLVSEKPDLQKIMDLINEIIRTHSNNNPPLNTGENNT